MATQLVASSFSQNGDYFAYCGVDGVLKIWETATGKSVADFTPSKSLSAACSCLQWSSGRHVKSNGTVTAQPPPRKKKKKAEKADVEAAVNSLSLLAMGTSSGTILLYSFARGEVYTHLDKGHTDEVTAICWHPHGTTLYSSSLDGFVVEWDVAASKINRKWKASNGNVHSMCLCGSNRLLTAERTIKMWDLQTRKEIQTFTGHSTEVFRLLPVLQRTPGDDETYTCSYFLSAATNDGVINAWYCHPGALEKNAVTSFSLPDDPADIHLHATKDQSLTLAILTAKGKVLVFEHTLNGKLSKPLKPKTILQATTEGSREEVSVPVPILAALPRVESENPGLLVAHGSVVRPKFESVSLRPTQPEIVLVVSVPEKKAVKENFSQVKTPQISGSSVLYPSHITPVGPNTEPGPTSRRKRKKSVSDLTVVERLEAMGVGATPGGQTSKPPKADQLVTQLTQGLQSGDSKLLTNAFQERNETTVMNTVKRLPIHVIHPLLKEIIQRMTSHGQSGRMMGRWMQQIMCNHMAYLTTIPDLSDTLGKLYNCINHRLQPAAKQNEVRGRLNLMSSRVAMQGKADEEPAMSAEPLLVYQDESSDDEDIPMEWAASESEDNWEDMD